MLKISRLYSCLVCLLLSIGSSLIAQESFGGYPLGLLHPELESNKKSISIKIDALDDEEMKVINSTSLFAVRKSLSGEERKSNWQQLSVSTWRWSMSFSLSDTLPVAFVFDTFNLPEHARLFIYNQDGSQVLGAFTSSNNTPSGDFMSDLISGQDLYIELVVDNVDHQPELPFTIDHVYQSYIPLEAISSSMQMDTGFMASLPCHPNANCPEGDIVNDQKRSVCRILMVLEEGLVFCSGTLMNNTLEDQRPLILSASHCQDYLTPMHQFWRFDFNFMTDGCENPDDVPSFDRIVGCRQLAVNRDSDMLLLELNFNVPSSFDVYYAGWNRDETYIPQPAYQLHHPLGDVMKVSLDNDDLRIFDDQVTWDNTTVTPPFSHYRCVLDVGAHQVGSSGGPLLDENGRVVGQLHGGGIDTLDCSVNRSFYGRLSTSWTGGGDAASRLEDWLDPFNSDTLFIDGLNQGESTLVYQLVGSVTLSDGTPVPNVEVLLSGEGIGSQFTDRNGNFVLSNVPILAQFVLTPTLPNVQIAAGLSVTDVFVAQQAIIGNSEFSNTIQELATDVSGDGTVSAVDLVQMINVILGLQPEFGAQKVWRFLPEQMTFPNNEPTQFTAYKLGDVNFSFTIEN
jgi:hypothetical protein